MENNKINDFTSPEQQEEINAEITGLQFTKNFRSATAEEWYIFLTNYQD